MKQAKYAFKRTNINNFYHSLQICGPNSPDLSTGTLTMFRVSCTNEFYQELFRNVDKLEKRLAEICISVQFISVDMNRPLLTLVAGALDAFQIRVGNESSEVGRRDAFKDNTLCFYSLGVDTRVMSAGDSLIQLDCVQPRVGRYVSIENVDPVYHSQMKLCHVDVHYR